MADSNISFVKSQLDQISASIGQQLDVNIYHGNHAVATQGQAITEALLEKLSELDASKLRFSREDRAPEEIRESVSKIVEEEIKSAPIDIARAAGVAEALSDEVRQVATRKVKEIFEACRYLTKLDMDAAAELAADLIKRTASFDSTAFKLQDLRQHDEYTYFHSVNCCVLGTSLFRSYMKDEQELLDFGIGMLLHDIGKSKIDLKILNKPSRLSDDEYAVMMRHVVYGYNMVKNYDEMAPIAKNIVLNHHERLNGTGYTRGLTENQLSIFDLVAAICDVFDAVTTDRVFRRKMDVHRAVSLLIRGSGLLFHTRIVGDFLRGIGRFPVGTFVMLNNGEIGVVSKVNTNAITLPVIRVIFDDQGSKLSEPRELDLYHGDGLYIERPLDIHYDSVEHAAIDSNPAF